MKLVKVTPSLHAECDWASNVMLNNIIGEGCSTVQTFISAYTSGRPVFLRQRLENAYTCDVNKSGLTADEKLRLGKLMNTLRDMESENNEAD